MHTYKRDDRLSVWIQAALGLAGLVVTAIAVVAFTRADDVPRREHPSIERVATPVRNPHTLPRPNDYEAKLAASEAELAALRAQARSRQHAQQQQDKMRCVGGVLFAEVDGALTNIGTCSKRNY
jgi:hypothetical protein